MAQNMLQKSKDIYKETGHLTQYGWKQTLVDFVIRAFHNFGKGISAAHSDSLGNRKNREICSTSVKNT